MNRKVLSIILAAAMVSSSVIPQTTGTAKKSVMSVPKKMVLTIKDGEKEAKGAIKLKISKGVKIKKLSYKSTDKKVVKVTKKGAVKGIKPGQAKVRIVVSYVYKKKKVKRKLTTTVIVKNAGKAEVKTEPTAKVTPKSDMVKPTASSAAMMQTKKPVVSAPSQNGSSFAPVVSAVPGSTAAPEKSSSAPDKPGQSAAVPFESSVPEKSWMPFESEVPDKDVPTSKPAETQNPAETKNPFDVLPTVTPVPGWDIIPPATPSASVDPAVCDHSEVEVIPYDGQKATCESAGVGYMKCKNCGEIMQQNVSIKALGHETKTDVYAATCTQAGFTRVSCMREGCEWYKDRNLTDPLGHDLTGVYNSATCTQAGITYSYCVRTGCDYKTQSKISPALGHKFSGESHTCERCGHVHSFLVDENGNLLPSDNYTWVMLNPIAAAEVPAGSVLKQEATCTEKGWMKRKCSDCGLAEMCVLEMTPHVYYAENGSANWVITKNATCTESGRKELQCINCKNTMPGEDGVQIVPARGHNFNNSAIAVKGKEATCTEDGLEYHICNYCNATSKPTTATALGHLYDGENAKEAYDKKNHQKSQTLHYLCRRCTKPLDIGDIDQTRTPDGGELTDAQKQSLLPEIIEPKACNFGNWIRDLSSEDSHVGTCDMCGATKNVTCTVLNYTEDAGKNTHTGKCTICDRSVTKSHKYDTTEEPDGIIAPTCTQNAKKIYYCQEKSNGCDALKEVEIPNSATGHSWEKTGSVRNQTCTSGEEQYHCTKCGEKKWEINSALGLEHNFDGPWLITGDGYHYKQCTRSGCTEIAKKAQHDSSNSKVSKAGDCCNPDTVEHYCSVCGQVMSEETSASGKAHTGGSWGDAHQGGYCYKKCTATHADGSVCGVAYDSKQYTHVNGGTSDCHIKCSICGKTLVSEHSMTVLSNLDTVGTSKTFHATNQSAGGGAMGTLLFKIHLQKFAGKQVQLKMFGGYTQRGSGLNIFFHSSSETSPNNNLGKINTGSGSGNLGSESYTITVPSDGIVCLSAIGNTNATVKIDQISANNVCECGYKCGKTEGVYVEYAD